MVVLLAIALAILGYNYLQPKQPEYPNGRVIFVFALAGVAAEHALVEKRGLGGDGGRREYAADGDVDTA